LKIFRKFSKILFFFFKPGAELQWCKLSFFWEWFGFDPSIPNSHLAAEPVISTIRHLLNTGHTPLGNSLVDFLIKVCLDFLLKNIYLIGTIVDGKKTIFEYFSRYRQKLPSRGQPYFWEMYLIFIYFFTHLYNLKNFFR